MLGTARKVVQSEDDRRRIAYHEAGHAIVGMLTPGADPVRKVSIIPRGQALGVTLSAPDADVLQLRGALPARQDQGRAAAAAWRRSSRSATITTGAESDIQQATRIARGMVGALGDERGDRLRGGRSPRTAAGRCCPASAQVSEATQELVDREVRRIIEEAPDDVRNLLERERDKLDSLAEALLREETLDEADAYAAAGIDRVAAPA